MAPATSRTPSARPVASSAFAIYGRSRIDLAPTARSSASSRRCFVSGPTRGPTARRTSAAGRCPAGSATTTPSARTRRSATSRRWPFSGGPGDERAWTQQLACAAAPAGRGSPVSKRRGFELPARSVRPTRISLALLAAGALASACSPSRLALWGLVDALASGGGGVFASDDDPELIRDAAPFSLLTIEALLV